MGKRDAWRDSQERSKGVQLRVFLFTVLVASQLYSFVGQRWTQQLKPWREWRSWREASLSQRRSSGSRSRRFAAWCGRRTTPCTASLWTSGSARRGSSAAEWSGARRAAPTSSTRPLTSSASSAASKASSSPPSPSSPPPSPASPSAAKSGSQSSSPSPPPSSPSSASGKNSPSSKTSKNRSKPRNKLTQRRPREETRFGEKDATSGFISSTTFCLRRRRRSRFPGGSGG